MSSVCLVFLESTNHNNIYAAAYYNIKSQEILKITKQSDCLCL